MPLNPNDSHKPDEFTGKQCRLYLAPIRGITDWVYRTHFSQHFSGFDLAVAPFIATVPSKRFTMTLLKDVLPEKNVHLEVIPQLLGKTSEDFIRMAHRLFDLGYSTVNWNLGCPYPMVARKGRGSGLLPYPEKVQAFLDAVIPAIPNRLSIKTRLGRENPEDIHRLMDVFNQFPLTQLIVHPRTGIQMYTGKADREMFKWCYQNSRHPIVYNGDIVDTKSFSEVRELFPEVHAWMIGRGALVDPFLPAAITRRETIDATNRVIILKRFHDRLLDAYAPLFSGPTHLADRMKAHWQYWSQSFQGGEKIRKRICKTRHIDAYMHVVDVLFAQGLQWKTEI